MSADTLQLALNLARNRGWPVFPCRESDKRPCTPHGFKDASADPEQIIRLWRDHPGELIGIPTGQASGFSALDVDIKHDEARAWWHQHEHLLPLTRIYRTRSGGIHLYFRHADGVRNSQGDLAPGIDTRGAGGYVIFWFAAGCECLDHSPMADWPHWISRQLWPPPKPKREVPAGRKNRELDDQALESIKRRAVDMVKTAVDGQKHVCVRNAGRLLGGIQRAAGFSDSEAQRWLVDALNGRADDEELAKDTIAWGLQSGRGEPLEAR